MLRKTRSLNSDSFSVETSTFKLISCIVCCVHQTWFHCWAL